MRRTIGFTRRQGIGTLRRGQERLRGAVMADLLRVLREEIRRQAKKEVRDSLRGLRQTVARQRHEIARLKRFVADFDKRIGFLESQ